MSGPRRLRTVAGTAAPTHEPSVALTAPLSENRLIGSVIAADSRRANGDDAPDVIAAVDGHRLLPLFSDPTSRRVWAILCERHRRGERNELISIADAIRVENLSFGSTNLRAADIVTWINETIELAESALPALAVRYAQEIRETGARRQQLDHAQALVESLHHDPRPLRTWYADAVRPLLPVDAPHPTEASLSEQVMVTMKGIDKLLEAGRTSVVGVPSGISNLDQYLGGFNPGDLVVVAGRTGMGKTAFGLTVGLNAARAGFGVHVVSAEMPVRSLVQRILAQITGIEVNRLWRGPLGSRDHERLVRAAAELATLPISFVAGKRSWSDVSSDCRRAIGMGARLVVIDYLGLLSVPDTRMNRWEMIGTITSEAKQLALTTSVPVILLAQLNREVTKDGGRRPALWHLRDSGSIEQDADIVLLLHRDGAYEMAARDETAEINVAKFRNGPTGVVSVHWRHEIARFEDARGWDE